MGDRVKVPTSAPAPKIDVAKESLLSKYDVTITEDGRYKSPNPVPGK